MSQSDPFKSIRKARRRKSPLPFASLAAAALGGVPSTERIERFLTENGAGWAARRDVVDKAIFGAVQVLEVLADRPGPVEIEASFDGQLLLTGYLLGRNADRIVSRSVGGRTETHLHYDH